MTSESRQAAARSNIKKAQEAARRKQTLKHLPAETRSALGKEANRVRSGKAKTRRELEAEARQLNIRGRSKMGKDELRRAISHAN